MNGTGTAETRRISVDGRHELYAERHGDGPIALVVLHGGPGISFEYLRRLEQLAGDELTVLFYDQLGGGRSDRPEDDPSLWRVERFVAELDGVRAAFGLERMVLLGQSWGGCLALQYTLDHPDRVQGLVLSNTGASIPLAFTEMSRLRVELGPERYMRMIEAEARGDFEDPGYQEAVVELYRRHLVRAVPDREQALATILEEDLGPAYLHMWGPHEFLCTGALRTFDVTHRLGEITAPALIVSGMYDESTLAVNRALAEGLPDNNWIVFGHGSHETANERGAEDYLALIAGFAGRVGA
jgi:proline-specific peptidase